MRFPPALVGMVCSFPNGKLFVERLVKAFELDLRPNEQCLHRRIQQQDRWLIRQACDFRDVFYLKWGDLSATPSIQPQKEL